MVAYRRGDDVLVAVATRASAPAGSLRGVGGRWRDVLHGDGRSLDTEVPVTRVLDANGIAVLERV